MAKYSRFDERNKKRTKDKYRSEKRKPKQDESSKKKTSYSNADLKQLEKLIAR